MVHSQADWRSVRADLTEIPTGSGAVIPIRPSPFLTPHYASGPTIEGKWLELLKKAPPRVVKGRRRACALDRGGITMARDRSETARLRRQTEQRAVDLVMPKLQSRGYDQLRQIDE